MAKTSEVVKLNKRIIDTAQPLRLPDGVVRQRILWDSRMRGFGVLVGATTKSFIVQKAYKGRSLRVTVGRCPPFTLDTARRSAAKSLVKIADGINPIAEKRAARARGVTLKQALDLCSQTMKAKGRTEGNIDDYKYAIETYLESWLDRPLMDITRQDVGARHVRIAADVAAGRYANGRPRTKQHGRPMANAVMRTFRAVWRRAMKQHPELPVSPTINVDWFEKREPPQAAPLTELHKWHAAVMKLENAIRRDNLLVMLHTGLRRTNASEVKWQDVDFKQRLLHVPKPKSRRPFDLPLTGYLVELLQARRKENEEIFGKDNPWVFPAVSESGHIAEPRFDIEGLKWSPHDLRRWFISVAESLDISPYAIKLLVNHALPSGDVTAGYVQREVERLRPAMEAISEKLHTLCTPPENKVVQMPRVGAKRVKRH